MTFMIKDDMHSKAEDTRRSSIDELYVIHDASLRRTHMTARAGGHWLAEKDVTHLLPVRLRGMLPDKDLDYLWLGVARQAFAVELDCIGRRGQTADGSVDRPVPVTYRAEDVRSVHLSHDLRTEINAEHNQRIDDYQRQVFLPRYHQFQQQLDTAMDAAARRAGFSSFEENADGMGVRDFTAAGRRKTPQIKQRLDAYNEYYNEMVVPLYRRLYRPLSRELDAFQAAEKQRYLRDIMMHTRPVIDKGVPAPDYSGYAGMLSAAGYPDVQNVQVDYNMPEMQMPPAVQLTVADNEIYSIAQAAGQCGFTVSADALPHGKSRLTLQLPYTLDGHSFRQVMQEALPLVRELKLPAEKLSAKQSVHIDRAEPVLRQAVDHITSLHGGRAVLSRPMLTAYGERLVARLIDLRRQLDRASLVVQVLTGSSSQNSDYRIRCRLDGEWTPSAVLSPADVHRLKTVERDSPQWNTLLYDLAMAYLKEDIDKSRTADNERGLKI